MFAFVIGGIGPVSLISGDIPHVRAVGFQPVAVENVPGLILGGCDEEKWRLKVENQEMGVKVGEVNGDSVGLPLPRTSW